MKFCVQSFPILWSLEGMRNYPLVHASYQIRSEGNQPETFNSGGLCSMNEGIFTLQIVRRGFPSCAGFQHHNGQADCQTDCRTGYSQLEVQISHKNGRSISHLHYSEPESSFSLWSPLFPTPFFSQFEGKDEEIRVSFEISQTIQKLES